MGGTVEKWGYMRGRPKLGRQNASPVDQVCRGQLSICFEGAGNSAQYKGTCQPEHREPRAESMGSGADCREPRGVDGLTTNELPQGFSLKR